MVYGTQLLQGTTAEGLGLAFGIPPHTVNLQDLPSAFLIEF